ncbi:hypothetical protein [Nonomuraea sp. NPDC049684]|uniref:hypothetical protein n=1 Tax=Nonomuraea sp. NPDC049684 TaxID=3364356 RepID=UPI0037B5C749
MLAISLDGDVLYVAGDHLPYQRFDLMPEDWAAHFPGYHSSPPAAVTRGEADRQQGVFAQWEGRLGRTADASQGRG